MIKSEGDLQRKFSRWLKVSTDQKSGAFELKFSTDSKLAYSEVKDHQIYGLMKARGLVVGERLVHKISDSGIGFKPFDCFMLVGVQAFVVIGFNSGVDVVMIDVGDVYDLIYLESGKRRVGSIGLDWALGVGDRIDL